MKYVTFFFFVASSPCTLEAIFPNVWFLTKKTQKREKEKEKIINLEAIRKCLFCLKLCPPTKIKALELVLKLVHKQCNLHKRPSASCDWQA